MAFWIAGRSKFPCGRNAILKVFSFFTGGWDDNGLQNYRDIQPGTYKVFAADPNDEIIFEIGSLKTGLSRALVQKKLRPDLDSPYMLQVDNHLLSPTDHKTLSRNLSSICQLYVDLDFRNSKGVAQISEEDDENAPKRPSDGKKKTSAVSAAELKVYKIE
jgi:hypothetical protein